MDLVVEIGDKDMDNILVPYGKRVQYLGGFFVTRVWDIRIICVEKVFNTIKIIVD